MNIYTAPFPIYAITVELVQNQNAPVGAVARPITSNRSTLVRVAEESDLDFLVSETKDFSKFFGTKRDLFPGDELARIGIRQMLEKHLFLICEVKGVKTGFISGYYLPHPFNPNLRLLAETFFWVKPEYRAGRSAFLLLSHFVNFGRKNADWITFALENQSPMKAETLERWGFKQHERAFLLET